MEINLGLQLKQTQKMVMSQRMIQSLNLLQMPRLELSQLLRQELMINPMLEELMPEDEEEETTPTDTEESNDIEADRNETDWEQYLHDAYEPYSNELGRDSGEEEQYEPVQVAQTSLMDELLQQLHVEFEDEHDLEIGEEIIGEISAEGYLTISCAEIAQRLNVSEEDVERILATIQDFDPPGIGARDLRETLLLQLKRYELDDVLAYEIVDKCFPELEKRLIVDIAKKLDISTNDEGLREVQIALDLISTLDPKPGLNISRTQPRYISPDLFVKETEKGFVVSVNDSEIPRIQISPHYQRIILGTNSKDKDVKDFVISKLNSAKWLIKSIDQRRSTMIRVMEAIIERQIDFFRYGMKYLKPMTLREIADDVGVHESTVSRVTSNKYVQTPRGIYELKFFFDSKVETESGRETSSTSVMEAIKKLIENEDPKKPHSDNKLVDLLSEQGIIIARRTVAKYRDAMKILPARYRKRV